MSEKKHVLSLTVNGKKITTSVSSRLLLTDLLRTAANQKSVRFGCEEGACGACTIEMNGKTVKSCLILAISADKKVITTVENHPNDKILEKVQEAFAGSHALQCGYCTSGMIMSATALIKTANGKPLTDDAVKEGIAGNICRCTGYTNIVHAIKVANLQASPLAKTESELRDSDSWIGQPLQRREDKRLTSGRGRYVDNYQEVGDLYAAVTRSNQAHAKIVHIDTSVAESMHGVHKVICGDDAKNYWNPLAPTMELLDLKLPKRYALATGKTVFYGEALALVIADDPYIAEDAALSVKVTYEPLTVNTDPYQSSCVAVDSDAILYPEWGTNIQVALDFEHGDVDEKFASADLIIDEKISSHRYSAMPMETRSARAVYDPNEKSIVVRASTQIPHQMRMAIGQVFGLSESRIKVLAGDVGGGFGAKLSIDSEYFAILGSILCERPVNWVENRSEWMHAGPGARDYHTRSRMAFTRSGKILAMETKILADMGCDGAERGAGIGMPLNGGNYAPGPYIIDTYRTHVECVVTNKGPYNAYRGYGKDLANMLIERVLDQAADRLEIDPLEIRRRNLLTKYPFQLVTGPIIENGSIRECLDKLEINMGLKELRTQQIAALENGRYLGMSLIPYIEPAGATFPGSTSQNYESITLKIASDGSVHVVTAMQNIGQGIETAYAQVCADQLGCAIKDVTVSWGDTKSTPFGSGTFSSRGAMFAVGAIINATEILLPRIRIGASVLLKCKPEDVIIRRGIISDGVNINQCTFKELAYAAYVQPGAEIILADADSPLLEALGTYRHPQVNWKPDDLGRMQFYPAHANGAAGALVEVDIETGRIDVKKIWMVADHGVILNPLLLKGQIQGSIVQQLGGTIYENLEYSKDGIPYATTLKEYGIPTVWATPEIEIDHITTHSPSTSIGAKGAGEDGSIATSTVLMAAVEDALRPFNIKVMSCPLSPSRMREMIRTAQRNR
jgi:aerobic carbon-monoxide dehydrogenase large subunit